MCLLIMYLKADLCVYPTWSLLSFLDVQIHIFHPLWEVFFGHYFFNYFFYPFLFSPFGTPTMHMLVCLSVSHGSLRFCSFFLDVCLGGVRLESGGIRPRSL